MLQHQSWGQWVRRWLEGQLSPWVSALLTPTGVGSHLRPGVMEVGESPGRSGNWPGDTEGLRWGVSKENPPPPLSLVAQMVKNLPAMKETQVFPWVGKTP